MSPSARNRTRSAIAAACASWVTITVVWPSSSTDRRSRPRISPLVVGVEVAGRLVGEHHRRARDERAGDGDALLLAAGELGRPVRQAVAEADGVDHLGEPGLVGLAAGELERQRDVLGRREHREQVEELEDEADVVAPQARERRVVEAADVDAGDLDGARGRLVEPGEDVHEGGLAGARRAHDGGQAALGDVERHAAEGVHGGVALAVGAYDVTGGDDGLAVGLDDDGAELGSVNGHAPRRPVRDAPRPRGSPGLRGRRALGARRFGSPPAASGLQELEHGQHAAVLGARVRQPELAEDARDVLLHAAERDRRARPRSPGSSGPRPRAAAPRARGRSASAAARRPRRPSSRDTTCGSSAEPPRTTWCSVPTKSSTSVTRCLSR